MTNAVTIVPYADIERMAIAVAKSGLFGIRTKEQAEALMVIAQAEGRHPAIAARDYHIINGKPSLKSDALLARFQQNGGRIEWGKSDSDDVMSAKFSHPQGGTVEIRWTLAMAERAGLTRNPTWRSYPRQMLRARVISEGVRAVFPGVAVGTYTVEEVQDMAVATGPVLTASEVAALADPVDAIRNAADLETLKLTYRDAVVMARKLKDKDLEVSLNEAKDARKAELEAIVVTPQEVEG